MSSAKHVAFVPSSRGSSRCSISGMGTRKFSDVVARIQPGDVDQVVGGTTVFDPVVNVPALSSFLVIAALFSLLQFRISAIGKAVERRKTALDELRQVKAMELSSEGEARPNVDVVSQAELEYEMALRNEENLRTVVPGVRLVAPNSSGSSREDVDAARRFLGLDLQPGDERPPPTLKSAGVGLSTTAKVTLAIVALSQVALLYILSFDPMSVSNTFTSIGSGAPPPDIPLSSW